MSKLIKIFKFFSCLVVIIFFHTAEIFAAEKTLDVSRQTSPALTLTSFFQIYEDPSAKLTIEQVRAANVAAQFKGDLPNEESVGFGFTDSAYWFRLHLTNSSDLPVQRMLQITYPLLNRIEFFQPDSHGHYQSIITGSDFTYDSRPYPNRYFVFPIDLPAHADQIMYFRFQAIDALVIPATLWQPAAFHEFERDDYFGQAWYFGMAVAMILFNLMLFVGGLRGVIYLMYVAFGSSVMLTIAARNGFAQSYLTNGQMMWSSAAVVIGFSLSFGTLMIFMRRMLNTNRVVPRLDRLLKILIWFLFLLPIPLLFTLHTFIKVAAVTYAISALTIIATSISCAYLRQRSAYFFVVAFLCLVAGSLFAVFRAFGWLPTNVITVNGMQFGSVLEMLLLALALADRYNVLRREKDLAQMHAIAAQTQLVETLRSSERALEVRVAERTEELSNTIHRLEQTQTELVQSAKLAALGSLVAAVAHELNTPIGNAVMTASALEDETKILSAEFHSVKLHKSTLVKYLELAAPMASLVLKSCNRAADLIVSFKRVAVDQTSEKRRSFDLRALIDDNITALWPSYKHQPWVVSVTVPEGIQCDSYPVPLGQVVVNLVQNAVAHAFVGRSEGHLEISAEQVNGTVKLKFTDNGHGMHPDILKNIFEPFFTTKLGQGGSGLGLSIVMNIVTGVLGGSISAHSELGKGSSFTLILPIVAPTKESADEQENGVCVGML